MSTTNLSQQIEALVHTHLAQIQAETSAAVERAFASARIPTRKPTPTLSDRAPGKRRDPTELAELAERLHAEIMADPGERMTVYAKRRSERLVPRARGHAWRARPLVRRARLR